MPRTANFLLLTWVTGFWLLATTTGWSQETFDLVVDSKPELKSTATFSGNRVTITTGGSSYGYVRQPKLDSADGKYAAYYSVTARQYVRFPFSGTGKMLIGSSRGLKVTWRESQMTVRPRTMLNPAKNPLLPAKQLGQPIPTFNAPPQLAQVDYPDGTVVIAHVDHQGKLQMVRGKEDSWKPLPPNQHVRLVANAPIALVFNQVNELPAVVSVDQQGRLVEVINGRKLNVLSRQGDPVFSPGAAITVSERKGFLCDRQGRIWQYDPQQSAFMAIETRPNLVPAGAPLAVLDDQLFVIDRLGNLVGYTHDQKTWSKPFLVKSGFQTSGMIGGWSQAGLVSTQKALVSVQQSGQPIVFFYEKNSWIAEPVDDVSLPPGSPIGISNRNGTFWISCIDQQGNWLSLKRETSGLVNTWVTQKISRGFNGGAPILVGSRGSHAFSLDRSGQLIAAQFVKGNWNCYLCNTALRLAPRLRQREIVPNPPLPPVEIMMRNDHREMLVVRVFDRRDGLKKYDLKLAPHSVSKIKIDRDAGAVARESITLVGPRGGGIQDVRVSQLPAQSLYEVVVFEHKVTSQYFDRTKNKSSRPDSEQKALVSVGVFPIPAGEQMKSGSQVSVFSTAKSQKNPGAAARFGPIKQ